MLHSECVERITWDSGCFLLLLWPLPWRVQGDFASVSQNTADTLPVGRSFDQSRQHLHMLSHVCPSPFTFALLQSCRIIQSCERLQLTSGELKGTWWLPHGAEKNSGAEGGTGRGSAGAAEADAVMQLAVKQRMNTDSRRAIFCILMSADDYVRFSIRCMSIEQCQSILYVYLVMM